MESAQQIGHLRPTTIHFFAVIACVFLWTGIAEQSTNAALLSSTATSTALINPAGGNDASYSSCPTDSVVVGFRWSGGTSTTSPYSIYCRALNNDGTIPADQSAVTNSTQVLVYYLNNAANVTFCPAGTIATGVRHRGWSAFALICNTPPGLSQSAQYSETVTTPTDRTCPANSVLMGMGRYTGAWLDSLYGVCKAFAPATISYNVNSGSGTAPSSVTQLAITPFALSSTYTGTRAGFTFAGWNTLANGSGTSYAAGASTSFSATTTLYAQWNSVISYDGNGNTGGAAPANTIATGSAANTSLATNSGTLVKTGFVFGGWNTAVDGSGTSYAAGLTTYASTGSSTLYAQWNSVITYNGNGNTSGTVPAATTATKTNAGTTLATNSGSLAKTGSTFSGWNTAADGSGVSYAAGATNYQANGATTLYALWNSTANAPDLVAGSDTGSSSTDNNTSDQTPELSGSNLTPNATVVIELKNTSTNALVGSCTFVATTSTGSCSIAPAGGTPIPSGSYYARVVQTMASTSTTSASLTGITIDVTAPTPQIVTTSGTSQTRTIIESNNVTSTEVGTLYLVRNSITVTDVTSITSASANLWKSVTISTANTNISTTLSALLGGTYRAYAVDQHGNLGGPSTNSLILYSQPAAATSLVATPGTGSMGPKIDLTWTEPTNNGGGISFYNVEYSTNNGTTWSSWPNKGTAGGSYSIYPVQYDTDYIFKITPVNLWGIGVTSVDSNVANVVIPNCSPTLSPNGFTSVFPIGACKWTVPVGVTSINIDARGGQGGWGVYGYTNGGGQLTGRLTVTPGEELYLFVGDQGALPLGVLAGYSGRPGFNGGGWGGITSATQSTNDALTGGGGGGASDIRTGTSLASRVAIAGGAGGSAYSSGNSCCVTIGFGGAGGGATGGVTITSDGLSGGGGTQSAGGAGNGGTGGALGVGGAGKNTSVTTAAYGGGGGGGGYYGGGGGNSSGTGAWFTGGGGGSSYATNPRFTVVANNQGVNCAPGFLAITIGNDLSQVPGLLRPCGKSADTTPPVISTQTVSADGRTVTLTYTDGDNMSSTYFNPALFTLTSGGSAISISTITATGKTLVLTLARNIVPGAVTTISYAEPTNSDDTYAVQDAFGNDAISFTNRSITTSGITVAAPTTVALAASSDTGSSSTDGKTNDSTPTISASSLVIGATVTFSARIGTGTPVTCVIVATATTDSCTFSTLPDGAYTVTVTQISGTVTSSASAGITVDVKTVGPTVAVTNNLLTNNGTHLGTTATTFTMTFSASVTGFTTAGITKTGNNWVLGTLSGSGPAYTMTATNSTGTSGAEGVLTYRVNAGVATDIYGNTNSASSTFTTNWIATITYNSNGGSTTPGTTQQSTSTAAVSLLGVGAMAKTGHTFSGWATTSTGTTSVGATYTPTANTTLYAIWTPAVYVVTYNANGGVGLPSRSTDSYTYGTAALTLPTVGTLTRQGFTFRGWGTTTSTAVASAMTTTYTPPSTITLYAVWQGNSYAVTFNKNDATATGTMANQAIVGGTAVNATANAFARVGFTFGRWNTAADGSGTNIANSGSMTFFDNTTLYAQWVVVAPGAPTVSAITSGNTTATVTVTGVAASGTSVGATTSFTVQAFDSTGTTAIAGKTCTMLASASPLACTISGLTNNTTYKFKATATNATGTATGAASTTSATPLPYLVTYSLNGGTLTPTTANYNVGTPIILPLPTKAGYNFVGWYASDSSGEVFVGNAGTSYSPSSAITLYARFTGITYSIRYNGNGNTGGIVPATGTYVTGSTSGYNNSRVYEYSGADQFFSVPSDISNTPEILVEIWGAGGGGTHQYYGYDYGGGAGGYTKATIGTATPGEVLTVKVGQGGAVQTDTSSYGGGGAGGGGGAPKGSSGGGLSGILTSGAAIAISGGGGGASPGHEFAGVAGGGGGANQSGGQSSGATAGGRGGTISAGGAAAAGCAQSGTSLTGGAGCALSAGSEGGGGGGGGYFGGGGGNSNGQANGGGGGGSGYLNTARATLITASAGQNGALSSTFAYPDGRTSSNYANNAGRGGKSYTNVAADSTGGNGRVVIQWKTGGATHLVGAAPTKTGYSFTGWNSKSDGTGTSYAVGAALAPSVDLTLYAQWAPQVYTITYDRNGGTGTLARASDSYTYGTAAITLPAGNGLTKAGFSFTGWSESATGIQVDDPYLTSQSRTLYAMWTGIKYSITYDINGGTGSIPDATYTSGDVGITLNNGATLTRTGYDFGGWKNLAGATVSGAPFTTAENVTLYAIWNPKSIAIQFSKGIATAAITLPANANVNYGSNYTLPAANAIVSSTTIGSDTYAFAGWSIGGVIFNPGDPLRINTESALTVTAQWLRLFDVRYNLNGGVHAGGDLATESECITEGLCADGQVITINSAPTRTGYTFNNWVNQSGATITDSNNAVAGVQTALSSSSYIFYATWTPTSFTFSFGAGAGSNGNATLATASYGDTVALPLSTGYILAGSKFSGWLINGALYPAGSLYTVGADASPISATAQFVNDTFKVFYNTNGANTGADPAPTVALQGANITFNDATGFGRSGYTFDGWLDGATKRAASYATTMAGANSTVVAQWIIAAPSAPTISGVTAGDSSATITVAPGAGGGAPTSYTITASPGGATCTVISPATSCTISPLTNGTSYTFSATATNSTGISAATISSAITPAGTPSAPSAPSAARGNGQATVTVTPLAADATGGKAITAYTVTAYDASGNAVGTPCQVIPAATSCAVTGLTNGSAYTFKVSATNGVAISSLSVPSAPTTPATVPGAPTGVTATTTSPNSATISFTAPVGNGGDAITSYTITSSPGGFSCTVAAPGTSCAINGSLTNGVAYTFTAVATNSVGNSLAAAASTAITPIGPPSAPTGVTATPDDGGATISFTAPNDNGSAITGYLVTALDASGVPLNPAVTCTPAPGTTTCSITSGLTNGVPYKFSVVATNNVGPSPAGITAATTTPQQRIAPSMLLNGFPAGTTSTNQSLTAPQLFDGVPAPTVTYQWQRCTSPTDLTTCTNISGATSSSYQLINGDVDSYIRVIATAANGVAPNLSVTSDLTDQVTGIPTATTPTTGLTANINESYTLATVAFGGAVPLTYAITSGTLPAGMTLDPLTGNISGTPTTVGTSTITVSATDQKGAVGSITFTISVVDPTTPPAPAPTPSPSPTPSPTPINPGAEDAAAAAAAKAAAERAAAAAAAKAAAERAAADAAAKAATDAAAKLASDRAAADAAARLAAEKRAAAEQAQATAQATAQAAAARATAAESARKAAADAAARAAALSRSNLVSNAAKRTAAAQAAAAEARAAAAVNSAAQAASVASTANANAAAASKEVVITVGALTSAQSAAEKSAALEAQATAARAAAKQAADAAAFAAQAEREKAAAATKVAADALAAAAEKQRLAAAAQAAAQSESERLAKAAAERALAKAVAEKAATEVASLLSEQAKLSEKMMTTKDPAQIAEAAAALEVLNEKLETAQDSLDEAVDAVESAAEIESELTQSVNAAVSRATSATKNAKKASAQASIARTSAQTVVARALVAERAAKSADAAVKKVIATKKKELAPTPTPTPTPTTTSGAPQPEKKKSDAVITVGGLKPGQKIRVIVKVNIK